MGDFRKERSGFSGQNLHVAIMTEDELMREGPGFPSGWIGSGWLNRVLSRAFKDPKFTHIRLIDEYGTTFFNSLQLIEVIKELEDLREFTETPEEAQVVEDVVQMAEKARKPGHYLVFLGD